ncbi:MAG: HAD family phosphatase [Elusimicrobia bacterium]|nr:HAD family phosphatase [Elusimicrobiota bacterium]
MAIIKAVLFDLDGVLVDATEWHYEAFNRALGLFGFTITRYEHLAIYNGLPTRKKLAMLTVEKGLPEGLHSLISRLKQIYTIEEIGAKCHPIFDKEYMIARLRQEGCRLAVCSNSVRETVEAMVRRSGIYDHFEFLLSNEDVTRAKPDPEMYVKAIARLGCDPDQAVIVEDAPHGIEAAKKSGAHVCEVSGWLDVDYTRIRNFIDKVERRQVAVNQ